MASAINGRENLGYSQAQIEASVVRYDAPTVAPPAGGASSFLIFNWAAVSWQEIAWEDIGWEGITWEALILKDKSKEHKEHKVRWGWEALDR